MKIALPRELVWKLRWIGSQKNFEKSSWRGVLDHVELRNVMPGVRSPDKETLSFYVPRTLGRRLRKMADLLNVTLTDVVVMILSKETNSVELTPEDYEQIARETRTAQRKNSTRSKEASPDARKSRA